ncbi:MAG: hypothetical protein SF182_27010 [Deltaproteobacteria bacterium]|nr:hypothetical protein [Deltaproteobacteria bacterium]
MTVRGHRVVPFAGQIVGVEWSGAGARDAAELAFGGVAADDDRLPDVIFRLGTDDDSPLLTLYCGRICLYRGESIGAGAHLLLQAALDHLVRQCDAGLVIHAAVLGCGDDALLLPGPTGSGKTMLSAWLSLRGLAPLSDEACFLRDAESRLESFARPFCFKGPWAELLGVAAPDHRRVLQDDSVSLVPRDLFGSAPRAAARAPRLIVFPHFAPDASFALDRLSPARAAVRLMETVANARNLPDHGVGRVTDLARRVDTYSLTYGRFDQLAPFAALLESLA